MNNLVTKTDIEPRIRMRKRRKLWRRVGKKASILQIGIVERQL
jgi:hypothetical protein